MRRRPSADGQQAATGVHQHPLRRGHQGRVVAAQGLGIVAQLAGRKHQRQTAVGGHGVHGHTFAARAVAGTNGIDQGQELLADVAIGVVGNGRVHERAPVQTLLGVRREARTPTRPTGIGEQGADAREQFAVDHRVQAQLAQLAHHPPDVGQQGEHRAVVQAVQMGIWGELQHARHLLVARQLQDVDLRLRVLLADAGKHGTGQHHGAHFGQHDDQHLAQRLVAHGGLGALPQARPQRQHSAQSLADHGVDQALGADVHGGWCGWTGDVANRVRGGDFTACLPLTPAPAPGPGRAPCVCPGAPKPRGCWRPPLGRRRHHRRAPSR